MSPVRWAGGLFCISAAVLAFELLLMRLLTLAYWGHFASFVISIAMLGIATSGLLLHFARERIIARPTFWFAIASTLFAILTPMAFACSQLIPFTPFLLAWSPREYVLLALRVFLFFVPFFFGGIAIGTPFVARIAAVPVLYFWNMAGSAAAFLPLLAGLNAFHPIRLLAPIALLGFSAALVVAGKRARVPLVGAGAVAAGLALFIPFRFSPYKDISKTLLLPDTRIVEERFSANGIIQTVESPHTRYLPGLSLNFAGVLPPARLIFTDGSAMDVVFNADDALRDPAFLRMSPEAFSYELLRQPRTLLLYAGATEILRATASDALEILALDDVKARSEAVQRVWQHFGKSLFQDERVIAITDEARHYLEQDNPSFDLISLSLLGSHGSSTAGAASLDPAFLLTLEGFDKLFHRLSASGHIAITTWIENPPNSGVRLAALIVETLRKQGAAEPGRHILGLRGWSTVTFFVARQPFETTKITKLKEFAIANSFDLVYYAGMGLAEANRVNVIPDEPYFGAIQSLLENPAAFRARAPFRVQPPSDDAPFFHHYFRWRAVPEFFSRMGRAWIAFIEWGYLLHVAAFLVAGLLGFAFLILPAMATRPPPSFHTAVLFFTLGIAYMLVEIWALYQMFHFLSQPALASAVVLTGMLAASGAGATIMTKRPPHHALLALVAMLLGAILFLPLLERLVFPQSLAIRIICALVWIAVPAFFMGFPFPFSLGRLVAGHEVAWALALNGFGSVIGSLGATLIAVHFGQRALALSGLMLYVVVMALVLTQSRIDPSVR
jgi:hypothetical protein